MLNTRCSCLSNILKFNLEFDFVKILVSQNIFWFIIATIVLSMLSFIFCASMWSFWVRANMCIFLIVCLYLYGYWRSNYQEGVGNPLTSLTPSHLRACPKPGLGFLTSYVVSVKMILFAETHDSVTHVCKQDTFNY